MESFCLAGDSFSQCIEGKVRKMRMQRWLKICQTVWEGLGKTVPKLHSVKGRNILQTEGLLRQHQTQQSVALNNVKFYNEVVADGRRGSQGQDLAERGRMLAISLSGEQQEGGDIWATWRTSRTLSRVKAESREGWCSGRLLWRPQ